LRVAAAAVQTLTNLDKRPDEFKSEEAGGRVSGDSSSSDERDSVGVRQVRI
jgi:hypothetical protein